MEKALVLARGNRQYLVEVLLHKGLLLCAVVDIPKEFAEFGLAAVALLGKGHLLDEPIGERTGGDLKKQVR